MASLIEYQGIAPVVAPGAMVAHNATLIGRVTIAAQASIWYGAVLRGDVGSITLGARSNIQDLACVHMSHGWSNAVIGADVTVGHGAVIHGAIIEDRALIGMGSVVLDNAVVGEESLIAAGAVVPPKMLIPPRSLVRGNPARVARELRPDEVERNMDGVARYLEIAAAQLEVMGA